MKVTQIASLEKAGFHKKVDQMLTKLAQVGQDRQVLDDLAYDLRQEALNNVTVTNDTEGDSSIPYGTHAIQSLDNTSIVITKDVTGAMQECLAMADEDQFSQIGLNFIQTGGIPDIDGQQYGVMIEYFRGALEDCLNETYSYTQFIVESIQLLEGGKFQAVIDVDVSQEDEFPADQGPDEPDYEPDYEPDLEE